MFAGLDSGQDKAVIPWGKIGLQQQDFIEDQFLPFKFEMRRDPSKMNKSQVGQLLEYWHKRQHNTTVAIPFRFKGYRDGRTGEIVGCDRKGKGKVGNNNKGRKSGLPKKYTKSRNGKNDNPAEGQKSDDQQPASGSDSNTDTDGDSEDDSDSSDELPLARPSTSTGQRKMSTTMKQKQDKKKPSDFEGDTDAEEQMQVKRAADARKKKLDAAWQRPWNWREEQ